MTEPNCPFCGAEFSHYTANGSGTRVWKCATWDNASKGLPPEQSITCKLRSLEAENERLRKALKAMGPLASPTWPREEGER